MLHLFVWIGSWAGITIALRKMQKSAVITYGGGFIVSLIVVLVAASLFPSESMKENRHQEMMARVEKKQAAIEAEQRAEIERKIVEEEHKKRKPLKKPHAEKI